MFKFVGSVCILFSAVRLGAIKSQTLRTRIRYLKLLEHLLILLLGEVQFSLRPLSEIFETLGKQEGGEGFAVAAQEMSLRDGRSAKECFHSAIESAYPFLETEDKNVLLSLGEGLGICDCATQCRIIESVTAAITEQRKRTEEFAFKTIKLYRGLSIAGGFFLILLFL